MSAPPPGLSGSLGLGGGAYPTLCFRCHTMVLLTAEQAVVAEAGRIRVGRRERGVLPLLCGAEPCRGGLTSGLT